MIAGWGPHCATHIHIPPGGWNRTIGWGRALYLASMLMTARTRAEKRPESGYKAAMRATRAEVQTRKYRHTPRAAVYMHGTTPNTEMTTEVEYCSVFRRVFLDFAGIGAIFRVR